MQKEVKGWLSLKTIMEIVVGAKLWKTICVMGKCHSTIVNPVALAFVVLTEQCNGR